MLYPVHLMTEYVLRRPLVGFVTWIEKNDIIARAVNVVSFGTRGRVGLIPTARFDFGLRPSVGLYLWANNVPTEHDRFSLHFAWGGERWWRLSIRETVPFTSPFARDEDGDVRIHAIYDARPDHLLWLPTDDGTTTASYYAREFGAGAELELPFGTFEDHRRAMIGEARMSSDVEREELFAILWGRRERVLEHDLRVRSPLAHPAVDDGQLCFIDLGALNDVWSAGTVRYRATMLAGARADTVWERDVNHPERQGPRVCLPLVDNDGARLADTGTAELDRYGIVAIETIDEAGPDPLPPILLHVVDHGDAWQLVGIERPAEMRTIDRIR